MAEKFYITTAIDYVNGRPHLGHAYEKVLTDMLARYERRKGKGVFFLTGVDEHGMKVQQSAAAQNREPQDLADENAARFRALYDELDVGYDDFVRTTEDRHKQVVQRILQELFDKGEIYEGQYEGFYSAKQEQFLTDDDKVDGEWPADFGEVVHLQEKVYYFKLSQYQDWLVGFLNENPDWIYPSFRTKEVLGKLDQPIPDMCISRPSSRLSWGIPLPFDKDQVTFVWFDALINYISVIGYEGGQVGDWWPAVHVIGKDIMAPAHAVYWPIMLKAIGVPMPQRLLVHGFWTMDQAKMSKSEGNVVDPLELVEVYGRDAFRYYVLREMALGQDADFSLDQFHQRYQSELGNNLGNLLNRTVSMIGRYRDGAVPQQVNGSELETAMKADVLASISKYRELMDQWQVHLALTELWKGITRTNQYIEEAAPWKLAKDEARAERLDCVLNHMATALWMLGSELQPILPDSVERIFAQLHLDQPLDHAVELNWPQWESTASVGKPEPLYPRIEREES
ncbi:MAG: methionine--tRNA ligase [Verrucomicrobiota bacterium]